MKKKTALFSLYTKDGSEIFAQFLIDKGWQILASGGTGKYLISKGISYRNVSDVISEAVVKEIKAAGLLKSNLSIKAAKAKLDNSEIFGHRVVTISRQISAALISRDIPEDDELLKRLGLPKIDLVYCLFYPIASAIHEENATNKLVTEMTDMGGPLMIRLAAKGKRIAICDSADLPPVIEQLKKDNDVTSEMLQYLCGKAECMVAFDCLNSANYQSGGKFDGFIGEQIATFKGENAWQSPAGLFKMFCNDDLGIPEFKLIHGAELSYNNWCDVDRQLQTMTHIAGAFALNRGVVPPIALGAKHGNECGASAIINAAVDLRGNQEEAIKKMVKGNTRAIFGGWVQLNFRLDKRLATILSTYMMPEGKKRMLDGIVAPEITDEAIEILKRKKGRCRFVVHPSLDTLGKDSLDIAQRFRYVRNGFLTQPNYTFILNLNDPRIQKYGQASPEQEHAILLAWAIGATTNSNSIIIVSGDWQVGIGNNGQDRVGAVLLAQTNAITADNEKYLKKSSGYSDSFFPFDDGPKALIKAGVTFIFTSSGSIRDKDTIKVCQDNGVVLYMIPDEIGRSFFGH